MVELGYMQRLGDNGVLEFGFEIGKINDLGLLILFLYYAWDDDSQCFQTKNLDWDELETILGGLRDEKPLFWDEVYVQGLGADVGADVIGAMIGAKLLFDFTKIS